MGEIQKIVPFLWFDTQAEEAANFYISVFKNGKILSVSHHDENSAKESGMPAGSVLVVEFELFGQKFSCLNGGPAFKFSEAVSFAVYCDTQEELDRYWNMLSSVPESEQCGWCKDKYGLSWQIIPRKLDELLADKDPKKAGAAMKAMLSMKKLDIARLQEAFDNA